MTKINSACTIMCGPYKDYCGRAVYDLEAGFFHGEVVGVRDMVTFQGKTPKEALAAFTASVDDYLAFCKERGRSPEKPFSGRFVARVSPELHRRLSMLASASGTSLNQYICEQLEAAVAGQVTGQAIEPLATIVNCERNSPLKAKAKPARPGKSTKLALKHRGLKRAQRTKELA